MRQCIIITGMLTGEEAKGGTAQFIAYFTDAHDALRSGGSQSGHRATLLDSRSIVHTHFNCGTLDGLPSYVTECMVVNPLRLWEEIEELETFGVNGFELMTIHQDCLTVIPYHRFLSRFREIMRGQNKKGTIGTGNGEAILINRIKPELTIRARDYDNPEQLRTKVAGIRDYALQEAFNVLAAMDVHEVDEEAHDELKLLHDQQLIEPIVKLLLATGRNFTIDDDIRLRAILDAPGTIVCEGTHGVLHHPRMGFVPHITQIDPTGMDIIQLLKKQGYQGKIRRLGVFRAYTTRQGAGPMVTDDPAMKVCLPAGQEGKDNDWLGPFRVGALDMVALKYAIAICGGAKAFDGFMLSYADALTAFGGTWPVCQAYSYGGTETDLETYFELDSSGQIIGIKVHPDNGDEAHLEHQRSLTQRLWDCRPIITTLQTEPPKDLEAVLRQYIQQQTGVPVVAVSYGPAKEHRHMVHGYERLFI